ncbi:MAG: hypothetical protein LBG79_05005 [Spirochaetaceae bacterium]|nr:hypothetical protein [Spirochaetaceae bacterium]
MKRKLGLFLLAAFELASCTGSPEKVDDTPPGYRPAFMVGDQVTVAGGEYAQSVGTVVEVDMDSGVYRVRLANRSNPVFIRSNLLRRYGEARQTPSVVQQSPPPVAMPVQPKPQPIPKPADDGRFGRLAILPVIGLEEYVAETLAWHLANEDAINKSFNVVPITPVIRKNVLSEESYSAIYNAGDDLQTNYILTSFARHIGFDNVLIMMIIDVQSREQIAGDFKKYNGVEEIPALFRSMSQKMTSVVRQKQTERPKLSVELMAFPPNTMLRNDAAVLTELVSITMANTSLYSVFPRTDSIDASMLDYETRRTTARRVFIQTEDPTAADFVLSSKIDMFNSKNQILAEIVDIKGNVLHRGAHINYDIIEDVPQLLNRLSASLTSEAANENQSAKQ